MAANREPSLPLVIICLGLTRSICALPMTPQPPEMDPVEAVTLLGFPTEGFVFVSEDYDDSDNTVTPSEPITPSIGERSERCDYNPCLENQRPCQELAASTGCLCPGFTPNYVAPEAPDMRSVSRNGSEVIVQWCAPLSFVTEYVVTVGGQDKYTFGKEQRSGSIGEVDHIIQVCVSAVNDAGESSESCVMYQPRDTSLALKAGLIGGAVGLLLLLLLVILLWRHRRQRKQEANISLGDTANAQ